MLKSFPVASATVACVTKLPPDSTELVDHNPTTFRNKPQAPPTACDSPSSVANETNRENSAPLRVPHLDQT
jgi:hypothetical protein